MLGWIDYIRTIHYNSRTLRGNEPGYKWSTCSYSPLKNLLPLPHPLFLSLPLKFFPYFSLLPAGLSSVPLCPISSLYHHHLQTPACHGGQGSRRHSSLPESGPSEQSPGFLVNGAIHTHGGLREEKRVSCVGLCMVGEQPSEPTPSLYLSPPHTFTSTDDKAIVGATVARVDGVVPLCHPLVSTYQTPVV